MTVEKVEKRRHLNIRVTEDEYNRIKRFCNTHGSITLLVRSLIRRFLVEQERNLALETVGNVEAEQQEGE